MTEFTIGEIVKLIIAVLVLTVIVIGAILGFRNYVVPYFSDLGPSDRQPDLTTPYYQELLKNDNLVASTTTTEKENFILLKTEKAGSKVFIKTEFYFSKKTGKIYKDINWKIDPLVGKTNDKGIIFIDQEYRKEIGAIHGAEKVGSEIYIKGKS